MYRLEPNDIQAMLSEAARVLTQPKDRELMRRLVASTRASDNTDWDRKLIAAMLAKAGKMHECEMVINDIVSPWERADAWCSAAKALLEIENVEQGLALLHVAAIEGEKAQVGGTEQEQISAAAVLADVVEIYAVQNDYSEAERVADVIVHPIRQQRAKEKIKELRGDPPEVHED